MKNYIVTQLFLASSFSSGLATNEMVSPILSSKRLRVLQDEPMTKPPINDGGFDLPAWAQDWIDNSFAENVDWSSPTAFQDWMSGIFDSTNDDGPFDDLDTVDFDLDVCPALETLVGMGRLFGIAADCSCDGDMTTRMEIACSYQQCLPVSDIIDAASTVSTSSSSSRQPTTNNAICGNISLNFTFGADSPGSVLTSVCTEFPDDLFQDACFSYSVSFLDNAVKQSCAASYGGQDCDCTIENLCLNLNCSSILPGASMDTCQRLQMQTDGDLWSWIPQWDVFQPDFVLDADMVPWQDMDWDHLDWSNFNVTALEWTDPSWTSEKWSNLMGDLTDGISEGVCTFLETAVQLTEELGLEGSCKCGTTVSDGLSIDCDFNELCIDNSAGNDGETEPLCAAVNMTLNFDNLAGVDNEVCMDFFGDTHPTTCFSYAIPFANPNMAPSCSATYGEDDCICSIDEKFCILLDCSSIEESAVMDTCQVVELGGAVEAQRFMLPFQIPKSLTDKKEEDGQQSVSIGDLYGENDDLSSLSELSDNREGSGASALIFCSCATPIVFLASLLVHLIKL